MFLFLGKSQTYVCNISLKLVDKTRATVHREQRQGGISRGYRPFGMERSVGKTLIVSGFAFSEWWGIVQCLFSLLS